VNHYGGGDDEERFKIHGHSEGMRFLT
jgi:hypothetical protein